MWTLVVWVHSVKPASGPMANEHVKYCYGPLVGANLLNPALALCWVILVIKVICFKRRYLLYHPSFSLSPRLLPWPRWSAPMLVQPIPVHLHLPVPFHGPWNDTRSKIKKRHRTWLFHNLKEYVYNYLFIWREWTCHRTRSSTVKAVPGKFPYILGWIFYFTFHR